MSKKPNAQAFLAALTGPVVDDDPPPRARAVQTAPVAAEPAAAAAADQVDARPKRARAPTPDKKPGRAQLTHFGGYLDDETFEKIVLLRVRLKKDNSKLIKFAIEELYRKHSAKRAFGDA